MRQFRPMALSEVVFFTSDGLIRLKDINQWYVLGAQCRKCKGITRMDRKALERRFGRDMPTYEISQRLRCKSCQNREGNTLLVIDQWPR
jgi:hypothetical protein